MRLFKVEVARGNLEEVDVTNHECRTTRARLVRLRAGLKYALRRRRVAGWQLEANVVHCASVGLLRRGALSGFHSARQFIPSCYDIGTQVWPEVLAKIHSFAGIVLLHIADWDAEWDRCVCQSFASETGYGVTKAEWLFDEVGRVGLQAERDHFNCDRKWGAHRSALYGARLHVDPECSGARSWIPAPSWDTGRSTRLSRKCQRAASSTASGAGLTLVSGCRERERVILIWEAQDDRNEYI